ncbi:MAG: hypothetical protein ABSF82_14610 [Candidatus Bathyarchaeia archaeon]|jgi:hypothetical protein
MSNNGKQNVVGPAGSRIFATLPLASKIPLSLGNDKISSNVAIFDLPAWWTCPGKGVCAKYCTSFKPQIGKWNGVPQARWRNFWASLTNNFVDEMVAKIQESGVRWVRFHVSGDLYNQTYIQKIAEIARRSPQASFYLYTKSLHFDLTSLINLPNFTVIKSFGGRFDHLIDVNKDNYSRVIRDPKEQQKGEFLCPEGIAPLSGRSDEKFCGYSCTYCLSDKKTEKTEPHQIKVVFHLKKNGWNGNKLPPPPKPPAPLPAGAQNR